VGFLEADPDDSKDSQWKQKHDFCGLKPISSALVVYRVIIPQHFNTRYNSKTKVAGLKGNPINFTQYNLL